MDEFLKEFKAGLAKNLEKCGSSLYELEDALSKIHTAEGSVKVAGILSALGDLGVGAVRGLGNLALKTPELAVASALMLGSAGGAGLYSASKYLDQKDKQHAEHEKELEKLRDAIARLKLEHMQ